MYRLLTSHVHVFTTSNTGSFDITVIQSNIYSGLEHCLVNFTISIDRSSKVSPTLPKEVLGSRLKQVNSENAGLQCSCLLNCQHSAPYYVYLHRALNTRWTLTHTPLQKHTVVQYWRKIQGVVESLQRSGCI